MIRNDMHSKRICIAMAGFFILVAIVSFLNYQMDDERYFMLYDYINIPEDADLEGGVINIYENTGLSEGDTIAEIPAMHVDAGSYIIDVDHQGDEDFDAVIYDGERELIHFVLPKEELNSRLAFSADDNIYNLRIIYKYAGKGRNTVKRTILYSEEGPFYYDTILFSVLLILAAGIISYVLIKRDFFRLPISERLVIAFSILMLIFVNYPFFRPFSIPYGDIAYHSARIEGIYRGWKSGHCPVFFYPDIAHGRGMIGALYPHLFFTIPAILRMIRISPEAAIRVWLMLINTSTAASAYFSTKIITSDKRISVITMMLYLLLPYRITTMIWKDAYGEALAIIFIPMVIAGLYETIYGNRKNWPILALGISGIIESHILSTIQMAIVCISIGLVSIWRLIRTGRIFQMVYTVLAVVLLNLWYIVPFLSYYTSDINVNANQPAMDLSSISYYMAQILQLSPNLHASTQAQHQIGTIGLWLVLIVLLAIYLLLRDTHMNEKMVFSSKVLFVGFFFLLMSTKIFPWQTLEKFQGIHDFMGMFEFAPRFLLTGESLMLLGAIVVYATSGGIKYKRAVWVIILIVALFQGFIITDAYLARQESFIDAREYRFQPDIADGIKYDFYAPEGYDYDNFNDKVTSPHAEISDYKHIGRHTEFAYKADVDTYIEIPLVIYEGYKAKLKETNSDLCISKGSMGCIRVDVPGGSEKQTVNIDYVENPSWRLLIIVSVVSFILMTIIWLRQPSIKLTIPGLRP